MRELVAGLVAFSPLGRGMLTGALTRGREFAEGDLRRILPRFQAGNLDRNGGSGEAVGAVAARRGASASQVALAWVLHQGHDVVPIPGTRRIANLEANAAATGLTLDRDELAALAAAAPPRAVAGDRYPESLQRLIDGG